MRTLRDLALRSLALPTLIALLAVLALGHRLGHAADKPPPPAPDYDQPAAWLAFPGTDGLERSTPPGLTAVNEADAPADVFFIHPTTYLKSDRANAPYDSADTPFNPPVRLAQISAFNGCCRLYAPHYRQASLKALRGDPKAVDIAYDDVRRAFRWYIAHENHGRPFILASHSQGSAHAQRLLQQEILGTPLQGRLVAAYVIGAYVPADFARIGLPTCDAPRQTGCIAAWNTVQQGRDGPRRMMLHQSYWWQGAIKAPDRITGAQPPNICVNPLTWSQTAAAPADANPGALPFPKKPWPTAAVTLAPLAPHLTGARCEGGVLVVDIGAGAPPGFHDLLSTFIGSYHQNDYGIFYAAIRANAVQRVQAWTATHPR